MKQRFIPSFCAFVYLCGSKFFNVLENFSPWKVSAVALRFWESLIFFEKKLALRALWFIIVIEGVCFRRFPGDPSKRLPGDAPVKTRRRHWTV
jgi:hypothetical protein